MGFTSTITQHSNWGNKHVTWGTFTNTAGSSGGSIDTGITLLEHLDLQLTGASVGADSPAVNETFPIRASDNSTVSAKIVTSANATGNWKAYGI